MDFVPSRTRARWKSLESVASFGWCGSAALGGYLADQPGVGYAGTFKYTAMIQGVATLLQATLLFIVPLHERQKPTADGAEAEEAGARAVPPEGAATVSSTGAGSVEPLIAPGRGGSDHSPTRAGSTKAARTRTSSGTRQEPVTPDGSIN